MLNPLIENAYKVLEGKSVTRKEALEIAEKVSGEDILDLVSLANKIRKKYAGKIVPCSILNAKSGLCRQNCRFCAQAADHPTGIETYPLMDKKEVLEAVRKVYETGVRTFGYVTSGYGYKTVTKEFQAILDTLDAIHEKYPDLKICVSSGILSKKTAGLLAKHHTWRYNMNLQTAPSRYAELISKEHTIEEKIQTIRYLQESGVTICCGGIFGLGENWKDRVEMAFAVRELGVDGCPLNVLLPIPGTPLAKQPVMSPADVAKAFALFRIVNPEIMIKFAAGRETTMKDFQGLLMLAGLNSMITGGYLTTRGRSVEDDKIFLERLDEF